MYVEVYSLFSLFNGLYCCKEGKKVSPACRNTHFSPSQSADQTLQRLLDGKKVSMKKKKTRKGGKKVSVREKECSKEGWKVSLEEEKVRKEGRKVSS